MSALLNRSTEGQLGAGIRVRVEKLDGMTPADIDAWRDLEERALCSNAYLSPHFVVPACRYLYPDPAAVFVVAVTKQAAGASDLLGVGVFERRGPTWRFPLGHLGTFLSRHSFLSGLLVDRAFAAQTVAAFFDYFRSVAWRWHVVEMRALPGDEPLFRLLHETAAERGMPWVEYAREGRAVLTPQLSGDAYLEKHLPSARRSDMRRCWRRLQEHGEVSWHAIVGTEITDAHIEAFLDLEHSGWKGRQHSSLRASAADELFFRAMFAAFSRQGRAVLMELRLNGRPVASTSHLGSGEGGFAFKLGMVSK